MCRLLDFTLISLQSYIIAKMLTFGSKTNEQDKIILVGLISLNVSILTMSCYAVLAE